MVRLAREKSQKIALRNAKILEEIRAVKADHPFWGYRRVWAFLRYVKCLEINKKRVLRLMRDEQLLVKPNLRLKAKRTETRPKPRPTKPNVWWGIDMTKVMTKHHGWAYIVLVKDWHTKKIVGHYAGLQSKSWHWLLALNKAVNRQFPNGARGMGLSLMSDNGCQPTSESFMSACHALGIKQGFTSYNNPKGNADTERVIRTMKEELFWLREWNNILEVENGLDKWVEYYNKEYLHSTLGYMPPEVFEKRFAENQEIHLAVA